MGKISEQTFSAEDTKIASKYMKRCLISLAIKEMKIKTSHNKITFHIQEGGH